MKRFLRPNLSVSRPKNSAPTTSPIRYIEARKPTCPVLRAIVVGSARIGETSETIWISSPSRIHDTPSPTTTSQWNLVHGSRSIRAGTRLRTVVPSAVAVIGGSSLSAVTDVRPFYARLFNWLTLRSAVDVQPDRRPGRRRPQLDEA